MTIQPCKLYWLNLNTTMLAGVSMCSQLSHALVHTCLRTQAAGQNLAKMPSAVPLYTTKPDLTLNKAASKPHYASDKGLNRLLWLPATLLWQIMYYDCRHSQSQHSHTFPKPAFTAILSASRTLHDILREVPMLTELLTADDQKAPSTASRSFREHFVAQVQFVTVTCKEDLALLIRYRWPLLSMFIWHKRTSWNHSPSSDKRLEALLSISAKSGRGADSFAQASADSCLRLSLGVYSSPAAGTADGCQVACNQLVHHGVCEAACHGHCNHCAAL